MMKRRLGVWMGGCEWKGKVWVEEREGEEEEEK